MIQVIGEMQNGDDAPWKKFTQTFFLAEQLNGYFVLNDIFMYLKEDNEFAEAGREEEGETVDAEVQQVEEVATKEEEVAVPAPAQQEEEQEVEQAPAAVDEEKAEEEPTPAQAEEEVKQDEPTPVEAPVAKEEEEAVPAPVEEEKAETAPEPPTSEPAETPKPEQSAEKVEKKEVEQPQQQQQQAKPAPPAAAPAPPKPTGPPVPKTWASISAAGKGAWGTALTNKKEAASSSGAAAQQPGQAAAPAPATAPVPSQPKQQQPKPAQKEQQQQQQQPQGGARTPSASGQQLGAHPAGKFPLLDAARVVNTNICFVKVSRERDPSSIPCSWLMMRLATSFVIAQLNNWQQQDTTPPVSEAVLSNTLGKYGEIAKIDFVRIKACAFVEYKSVDSARKAIIASLKTQDGGEGGIKIPAEGGGYQRIIVESRKEKEDRGKGALPGAGPGAGAPGAPSGAQQGAGQGPRRQGQQGQNGPRGGQGAGQGQRGGRGGRGGQQGQQGQARPQQQQQQQQQQQ